MRRERTEHKNNEKKTHTQQLETKPYEKEWDEKKTQRE